MRPYEELIVPIPDYPKPGIVFQDLTPAFADGAAFAAMVDDLAAHFADAGITKVVGAEARGFIVGAAVSPNFGLASSGTGIGTGPVAIAVVVGFVVLGVISVMNMQKLEG